MAHNCPQTSPRAQTEGLHTPHALRGRERGIDMTDKAGIDYSLGQSNVNTVTGIHCLGHDWFDSGRAPYPVYRVSDDSEVVAGS